MSTDNPSLSAEYAGERLAELRARPTDKGTVGEVWVMVQGGGWPCVWASLEDYWAWRKQDRDAQWYDRNGNPEDTPVPVKLPVYGVPRPSGSVGEHEWADALLLMASTYVLSLEGEPTDHQDVALYELRKLVKAILRGTERPLVATFPKSNTAGAVSVPYYTAEHTQDSPLAPSESVGEVVREMAEYFDFGDRPSGPNTQGRHVARDRARDWIRRLEHTQESGECDRCEDTGWISEPDGGGTCHCKLGRLKEEWHKSDSARCKTISALKHRAESAEARVKELEAAQDSRECERCRDLRIKLDAIRNCRDEHISRADKYKARATAAEARVRELEAEREQIFQALGSSNSKLDAARAEVERLKEGIESTIRDERPDCGTEEALRALLSPPQDGETGELKRNKQEDGDDVPATGRGRGDGNQTAAGWQGEISDDAPRVVTGAPASAQQQQRRVGNQGRGDAGRSDRMGADAVTPGALERAREAHEKGYSRTARCHLLDWAEEDDRCMDRVMASMQIISDGICCRLSALEARLDAADRRRDRARETMETQSTTYSDVLDILCGADESGGE